MRLYLDHNATSPMDPRVQQYLFEQIEAAPAHPDSLHFEGRKARALLEDAREEVASALGVPSDTVVFTSGCTEANNLAIRTLAADLPPGGVLALSSVEHPSVREPALREARRRPDLDLRFLAVGASGRLLDPEPVLAGTQRVAASIVLAQSEVGTIQPVAAVASAVHARGGLIHSDAAQALGRISLEEAISCCDLVSLTVHKAGGPRGVGILVGPLRSARNGNALLLEPVLLGGGQERGARAGTQAVALAAAASRAVRLAVLETRERAARMASACAAFIAALSGTEGLGFPGGDAPRLPNTVAVLFGGVDGRALLLSLDLEGVACSIGSACSSRSAQASPALLAMGFSEADARATVRFSFGSDACVASAAEAGSRVAGVFRRLARSAKSA